MPAKSSFKSSLKYLFKLSLLLAFSSQLAFAIGSYNFGPTNGTFYVGRQFEVSVNMTTDQGTTAADIEIFYDACKLTVVDALPLAGTQIYAGTVFPNYPNNGNVTTNVGCNGNIQLTGFTSDPAGVLQGGGTGLFGKIRFKVRDVDLSGNLLDMRTDGFGPSFTLDSNISNTSGFDMLTAAPDGNYTLRLDKNPVADGDDRPSFGGFNPLLNAANILIGANILFNIFDEEAGVDISTVTGQVSINGSATTTYTNASPQVSRVCSNSNLDAVPVCNFVINPSVDFPYDALVCNTVNASDLSQAAITYTPTPNPAVAVTNCFRTQYDLTAPSTINNIPPKNSLNIAVNTPFSFNLIDNETGSNINTVIVTIKGIDYTLAGPNFFTYTGTSNNYVITVPTATLPIFIQNETVAVRIRAQDNATQLTLPTPNQLDETYTFKMGDTIQPYVATTSPATGLTFLDLCTSPLVNVIEDTGSGVNISNLKIFVSATGLYYTAGGPNLFTYTGTTSSYIVTIPPPLTCWPGSTPIAVGVFAKDFAGNYLDAYIYGLGGSASSTVQTIIQTVTNTINGGGGTIVNLNPILPERIIREVATLTQREIIEKVIYLTGYAPSPKQKELIYNSVDIALDDLANAGQKAKVKSVNNSKNKNNNYWFFEGKNLQIKGIGPAFSQLEIELAQSRVKVYTKVDKDGEWTVDIPNTLRGYKTYTVTARNADDGMGFGVQTQISKITIIPWWWIMIFILLIIILIQIILYTKAYKKVQKFIDKSTFIKNSFKLKNKVTIK